MYGQMSYSGESFWILMVFIAMIIGMVAQGKIRSTYARFSRVKNAKEMTGVQAARKILDEHGLSHIQVVPVRGELTDHYDPTEEVIRLSEGVYGVPSVSSVSIAAHEVGHAIQHAEGYKYLNFRNALVPVVNLASRSIFPLILIGIFVAPFFIDIAIAIFAVTVLFQVVTLPVELDASSRAMKNLQAGILQQDELRGGRKVLSAAAMTYVAAALFSLAQLMRLLSMRRND